MDFSKLLGDGPQLMPVLQQLQQQQQKTCLNDLPSNYLGLGVQLTTRAMSGSTANAGDLTGAGITILCNTGATPGTFTSRTAAQMITDSSLVVGQTWLIIVVNQVTTNAITMAGGSNVTVGGTTTVAGFTGRLYTGLVATSTTITLTGLTFSWTVAGA